MYHGMRDELNRITVMPLTDPNPKTKYLQSGIFEKHILCPVCDNEKLGKKEEAIENYRLALQFDKDYPEAKDALGKLGVKE